MEQICNEAEIRIFKSAFLIGPGYQPLPHESPFAKQSPCNKLLINLECSVFTVLTEILQGQYSKTRDTSRVIGRVIVMNDFWDHWGISHKH